MHNYVFHVEDQANTADGLDGKGLNRSLLVAVCREAMEAGPGSLADNFILEHGQWGVSLESAAAADFVGERPHRSPLMEVPAKLSVLAAAQLGTIASVLEDGFASDLGIVPVARSVIECSSTVSWLLDDEVTSKTRLTRVWLLRLITEGEGAHTSSVDAGRTGAMVGSATRVDQVQAAIVRDLGPGVEVRCSGWPKHWRIGAEALPGRGERVRLAVDRWFPGADGGVHYSQISRRSHLDVLVALALVDDHLVVRGGGDLGVVATALAFWAQSWKTVTTYMGLPSEEFDRWLDSMLVAIGRRDLVGGA